MSAPTREIGTGLGGWIGHLVDSGAAMPGHYRGLLAKSRRRTIILTVLGVLALTYPILYQQVLAPFARNVVPLPFPDETTVTFMTIFGIMAIGLNIVAGFAGLLDLGYVAFFAVGAYSWAIFGSPQANQIFGGSSFPVPAGWFFLFLLIGIGVAAGAGILLGLPVLRLHGDYLAVVTLGFGEVIRVLANNLDKPINVTNGPKGITPISRPPIFFDPLLRAIGIEASPNVVYPLYLYFLVLVIAGVTILVNRRLEDSHLGRAWEAIREDQTAAQAMGVPLVRMKLLAFACGASFAGAVGVLFSAKQVFINPESFTFMAKKLITASGSNP